MFLSICREGGFDFQFNQIRLAINEPDASQRHAALRFGLNVLAWRYQQFSQELANVGKFDELQQDLETYLAAITELEAMFTAHSEPFKTCEARHYLDYLEQGHNHFRLTAERIADGFSETMSKHDEKRPGFLIPTVTAVSKNTIIL